MPYRNGVYFAAPAEFFGADIEPESLCRNCEYFDGGGLDIKGQPKNYNGDCRNSQSPRFETEADYGCSQFFPCTTRWPDADADN